MIKCADKAKPRGIIFLVRSFITDYQRVGIACMARFYYVFIISLQKHRSFYTFSNKYVGKIHTSIQNTIDLPISCPSCNVFPNLFHKNTCIFKGTKMSNFCTQI